MSSVRSDDPAGVEAGPLDLRVLTDVDSNPRPMLVIAVRTMLYDLRDRLPLMVVYDHPKDFPDHVVARLWVSVPMRSTAMVLRATSLGDLRDFLGRLGMIRLAANPADDPVILETWL